MTRSIDVRNPRTGKVDYQITPLDLPALTARTAALRAGQAKWLEIGLDGRIRAMAPHGELKAPAGARVIAGQGRTVMPGLIEGHSHLLVNPAEGDPAAYGVLDVWRPLPANLYAGVTTLSDLGSELAPAADLRDAVASGRLAGPAIHTVGDYFEEGTERSDFLAPRRLERLADYVALLERHHQRGVRMIKAYVTMPLIRLSLLAEEAAKRDMRVVADSFVWMGTTAYMQAGVAGFAHVPSARPLTAEEIRQAREQGVWFIGTAAISRQATASQNRLLSEGMGVLDDPMVALFHDPQELQRMRSPEYSRTLVDGFVGEASKAYGERLLKDLDRHYETVMANLAALLEAGVLVGLGTDPLFPGMFHGEAMHYEMEIWNRGGIDALRVIRAATHDNARILRIEDQVGAVRPGLKADLLVVDGNPAVRIQDTRRIVAVLKDGKIVDRDALAFRPGAPRP